MLKSVSYRWTRTGTQIRKCVERKLFLPRSPRKIIKINEKIQRLALIGHPELKTSLYHALDL